MNNVLIRVLKLHLRQSGENSSNNCNCTNIDQVTSMKFVWVMLDQHLQWDYHMKHMIIRLKKLFYFRNFKTVFLNLKLLKDVKTLKCCNAHKDIILNKCNFLSKVSLFTEHLQISQSCRGVARAFDQVFRDLPYLSAPLPPTTALIVCEMSNFFIKIRDF